LLPKRLSRTHRWQRKVHATALAGVIEQNWQGMANHPVQVRAAR
jgi:hypothetical protein